MGFIELAPLGFPGFLLSGVVVAFVVIGVLWVVAVWVFGSG